MKKTLISTTITIFILGNTQISLAQNTSQVKAPEPAPKILTGSLTIDTSGTLAPQSANSSGEDFSYSGLYSVNLGASLSRSLTATMRAGYSQEYSYVLSDGSSGDFIDSGLGLSAALGEIRKDLKLSISSNLTLPTSKVSQRAGLYSAVGLGANLNQKFKKWNFALGLGLTNFFHDREVQNNGRLNLERSVSLLLSTAYSLTEKLSASITFQPTHSWTYQGTTRDAYLLGYELAYEATKHLALALGIYNNASALKANGLDYNYALYDQQQFMGYFDIILNL